MRGGVGDVFPSPGPQISKDGECCFEGAKMMMALEWCLGIMHFDLFYGQ